MRKTLSWLALAAVLALAGSFLLGHLLSAPVQHSIGLQTFTPGEYERAVLGFLAEHLPTTGPQR